MIACPVAAVKAWLEAAAITDGPVFRPVAKGGRIQATRLTDRSVADIVKARAQRAGLDPKLFAGHSLRSGFLTSAAARGASIFKMADQSRHKSMDTLRGYVRDAEIFKDQRGKDCCRGATLDHRVVRARAPKQATEPIHRRDFAAPASQELVVAQSVRHLCVCRIYARNSTTMRFRSRFRWSFC